MPQTVQPGQLLEGRYLLIDAIGHGGMSTVWRARDERLGRIAAVKVLDADRLADADSRTRLQVEAQSLARLHHPYIADVYDYGVDDVPYLVMELVDGAPVAAALAGGRALPWIQAVSIAAQVAAALAAAHRRGIVHRDIAAGNVLLIAESVKVIDFGICASEGNLDADQGELLIGTPAYLAPERIAGQPVQPESDVYALGVLLYRMVSGDFPFNVATAQDLMQAHRSTAPPPLPAVVGMPAIVADLCSQCLAKDPVDRPTAADLSRSLFDLLGGLVTLPIPAPSSAADDGLTTHVLPWLDGAPQAASPPIRRFSRRAKTTTAAAGVLLALAAVWMVNGRDSVSTATPPAPTGLGVIEPTPLAAICAVSYQTARDDGSSFAATITVANVTDHDITDARLTFDLPGEQQLAPSGMWQQDGRFVSTVPGLLTLPVGSGVRLPFAGTYTDSNMYPLAFQLGGRPCAVSILGPGGIPLTSVPSTGPSRPPVVIVDVSPRTPGRTLAPTRSTGPVPSPQPSISEPASPGPDGSPEPFDPPSPTTKKKPKPTHPPH